MVFRALALITAPALSSFDFLGATGLLIPYKTKGAVVTQEGIAIMETVG